MIFAAAGIEKFLKWVRERDTGWGKSWLIGWSRLVALLIWLQTTNRVISLSFNRWTLTKQLRAVCDKKESKNCKYFVEEEDGGRINTLPVMIRMERSLIIVSGCWTSPPSFLYFPFSPFFSFPLFFSFSLFRFFPSLIIGFVAEVVVGHLPLQCTPFPALAPIPQHFLEYWVLLFIYQLTDWLIDSLPL